MIKPGEAEIEQLQLSGSFRVGDLLVLHVSDGVQVAPRQSWFHGVSPEEWMPAVGVSSPDVGFPVNYGCFAVVDQGQITLVDSGWGTPARELDGIRAGGELTDRLAELNIDRRDVSRIVQTHLHGDHCGGLLGADGATPTFPNAEIVVSSKELDYWTGPDADDNPMAEFTRSRIVPFVESGRVHTFDDEYALSKSITMLPTPGHTVGHCSVMLTSDHEHALLLGDVAHHPIHLEHHDWLPQIDADPAMSARSREAMARLAVERNAIVTAPHMPILTLGRMEALPEGEFRFHEVTDTVVGQQKQ